MKIMKKIVSRWPEGNTLTGIKRINFGFPAVNF